MEGRAEAIVLLMPPCNMATLPAGITAGIAGTPMGITLLVWTADIMGDIIMAAWMPEAMVVFMVIPMAGAGSMGAMRAARAAGITGRGQVWASNWRRLHC
jgi:hypothetical protein